MTDGTVEATTAGAPATDVRSVLAGLRPQLFGTGNPYRVTDPLIEPLWTGVRALAAIEPEGVALADDRGQPIDDLPEVPPALAEAAMADRLVLDGFLTKLAAHDGSSVYVAMDNLPSASQMVSRPLLGIRPRHGEDRVKAMEEDREARTFGPDDIVRFVAIDLLWLDGEELLDVPLLERRRLLESVLAESDLVRHGVFVRPPIDAWLGSWRSLGFNGLSYKAANSRYQPGVATGDWITIPMPRR